MSNAAVATPSSLVPSEQQHPIRISDPSDGTIPATQQQPNTPEGTRRATVTPRISSYSAGGGTGVPQPPTTTTQPATVLLDTIDPAQVRRTPPVTDSKRSSAALSALELNSSNSPTSINQVSGTGSPYYYSNSSSGSSNNNNNSKQSTHKMQPPISAATDPAQQQQQQQQPYASSRRQKKFSNEDVPRVVQQMQRYPLPPPPPPPPGSHYDFGASMGQGQQHPQMMMMASTGGGGRQHRRSASGGGGENYLAAAASTGQLPPLEPSHMWNNPMSKGMMMMMPPTGAPPGGDATHTSSRSRGGHRRTGSGERFYYVGPPSGSDMFIPDQQDPSMRGPVSHYPERYRDQTTGGAPPFPNISGSSEAQSQIHPIAAGDAQFQQQQRRSRDRRRKSRSSSSAMPSSNMDYNAFWQGGPPAETQDPQLPESLPVPPCPPVGGGNASNFSATAPASSRAELASMPFAPQAPYTPRGRHRRTGSGGQLWSASSNNIIMEEEEGGGDEAAFVPPPQAYFDRPIIPRQPPMNTGGGGGERQPLLRQFAPELDAQQQQQQQRRSRDRRRKSQSFSNELPSSSEYNTFWQPKGGNGPESTLSDMQSSKGGPFSARNEFMALASGFRPGDSSPRTSPLAGANHRKSVSAWPPQKSIHASLRGSEAAFLNQYKGRKAESVRARNVRDQPVQSVVDVVKGEPQAPACRDVLFLLLFVFHLIFIGCVGDVYGPEALNQNHHIGETEVTIYYNNLVYIACYSGAFAVVLSAILLAFMAAFVHHFVQVALMVVIALSFTWGTVGIGLSPKMAVPATGIVALACTVGYAFIVWDRIPFATSNLVAALSGVRAYPGTLAVAFFFQALAVAWCIYFSLVVCGIYDSIEEGRLVIPHNVKVLVFILLGLSFYWTYQVLQNCVQVVTAGVVRGWWYEPNIKSHVRWSFFKTFFYELGSICFGSLLVGPVRVLRQLSALVRPSSQDDASLMCLHEVLRCIQTCMSSCIDNIAANFNSWGFTYVGMYGYGFVAGSHRASEVFEKRGWTTIVSDDLVPNVLLITSLVIGGVTGCFAYMLSHLDRLRVLSLGEPGLVCFVEGIVVGLVVTSVLFGVISSSVNAVVVCFAAGPVELETNHPELNREMRQAWRAVWPGALDAVDPRLAAAQFL